MKNCSVNNVKLNQLQLRFEPNFALPLKSTNEDISDIVSDAESKILTRGIRHYKTWLDILNKKLPESERKPSESITPDRYTILCQHLIKILRKFKGRCRKKKDVKREKLLEINNGDYKTDTGNAHFNDKYITHYTNNKND